MTTAPDLPVALPPTARAADQRAHLSVVPAPGAVGPAPGAAVPAPGTVGPAPGAAALPDLEAAFERARPRLHRYALRRLGDPNEAEEVVQEALLRGYQHRHVLATEDELMAWLTVVTGRLAIDRLRVRGRAVSVPEVPATARTGPDTADIVLARAETRIALDALEAMPGRQAAVLWAREVDGLSYDAIADRYGLSEPTVRSLLHRARRTLRREYAARGGTVPVGGLVVLAPWLRALRSLPRLRELGRRAGAASLAATGLAVAGVLAIGAGPHPGTATATPPAVINAQVVTAPSAAPPAAAAPRPRATRPSVPVAPARPAAPPVTAQHRTWALPAGRVCGTTITVDCTTHTADTLYLSPTLPANPTGWTQVGVSNQVLDCSNLPTTPLTQCSPGTGQTSGGRP